MEFVLLEGLISVQYSASCRPEIKDWRQCKHNANRTLQRTQQFAKHPSPEKDMKRQDSSISPGSRQDEMSCCCRLACLVSSSLCLAGDSQARPAKISMKHGSTFCLVDDWWAIGK